MKRFNLERIAFSKVESWVVLLILLLASLSTVLFGWLVRRTIKFPEGKFASSWAVSVAKFPDDVFAVLSALGGSGPGINPQIIDAKQVERLPVEEPPFVDDGLLLLSAYSDEHEIPTVSLIELSTGKRRWEWVPDFDRILALSATMRAPATDVKGEVGTKFIRTRKGFRTQHPCLLPDGSIVVSSGEGVLFRLGVDSEILWLSDRHYHHSIERMADGNFIVPIVLESPRTDLRDDGYAIVSPEGNLIQEQSVLEILLRNGHGALVYGVGKWERDRIHLNDAQPIHEGDDFVRKGDVALSLRNLSTVFLYRPAEDRIVWLQTGPWLNQHDVNYLGEGRFSVFGNDFVRGMKEGGYKPYGNANVYVFNMASGTVTKPYREVFERLELRTATQGRSRILDNGDAFVSLTDRHCLLRLSGSAVRWQYVHDIGHGKVGALHWSRYLYRDEIELSWLERE